MNQNRVDTGDDASSPSCARGRQARRRGGARRARRHVPIEPESEDYCARREMPVEREEELTHDELAIRPAIQPEAGVSAQHFDAKNFKG